MAVINGFKCSATNCTNRITEVGLTEGGIHFIHDLWVAYIRAGGTRCQSHYQSVDIPTTYAAFHGSPIKRDRDKA